MTGNTDFLPVARQFVNRYSQRGLLVILSDFLGEADCEKPVEYLAEFGHELFLVQLWAEEDRIPPWEGELALHDAETGREVELDFDADARERYTRAFDEFSARIRNVALRHGGRYASVSTSTSIEEAVFNAIAIEQGVS